MPLSELTIIDLRCIEHAELSLDPGLNLFLGSNGSGKTSLLESVFLLGRGRSFRTRTSQRLIRHGRQELVVFGRLQDGTSLGIRVQQNEGTLARIGGAPAHSLTELSQKLAVQVIEPGIHKLVEEGSALRRRWLDWGVFHLEPIFVDTWTRYTRTLKQRNAALKAQPASQASIWEQELSRLGEQIARWRADFLEKLKPHWQKAIHELAGVEVELHYHRGWSQELSLAEALLANRNRDETRGVTHSGPHRADVPIRIKGRLAREVLSRGQQKLVAVAMILAQLSLMQDSTSTVPTLLLDDPAAELDREHLAGFIDQVKRLRCQLVVTALSAEAQPFGAPERLFHVDRGTVRPV